MKVVIEMTSRKPPITQPIKTIVQIPTKGNSPVTIAFETVAERPSITRIREPKVNPFLSVVERMAKSDETLRFEVPFTNEDEALELRTTLRLLSQAGAAVDRTVRRTVALKHGGDYMWTRESTPEEIAEGRGKTVVEYAEPSKGNTATVTFWLIGKIRQNRKA